MKRLSRLRSIIDTDKRGETLSSKGKRIELQAIAEVKGNHSQRTTRPVEGPKEVVAGVTDSGFQTKVKVVKPGLKKGKRGGGQANGEPRAKCETCGRWCKNHRVQKGTKASWDSDGAYYRAESREFCLTCCGSQEQRVKRIALTKEKKELKAWGLKVKTVVPPKGRYCTISDDVCWVCGARHQMPPPSRYVKTPSLLVPGSVSKGLSGGRARGGGVVDSEGVVRFPKMRGRGR